MDKFTQQNTSGFSDAELEAMNAELEAELTPEMDEQDEKYLHEKILRSRGAA